VGCELVREGNAWVYRKYTDDAVLYQLEAEARAARRGIWSLPQAQQTPPWEWRHAAGLAPAEGGGFACGGKRYCREMTSCAEARFHLEQCGLARLDGDGDGIPCESLCR
jgi:hypothetical protein